MDSLKEALRRDNDRLASFIRHANWMRRTPFAKRWWAFFHQTLS